MNQFVTLGALEILMVALVLAVSGIVAAFSRRYMDGDHRLFEFIRNLALLTISVLVLVTANHAILFGIAWLAMGHFLSLLIGHARLWPAAKAAMRIAQWHFLGGAVALAGALFILSHATGTLVISEMLGRLDALSSGNLYAAGGLLILAAMIQSAIFPFHRWLMTSMNAPTPVSAFMHAGIVNAGGFLIVRFHTLFVSEPDLLLYVFAFGALSSLFGSMWMMVQPDVKRSLGFSTVAQMGFMLIQCGLGLFTAAIVHLILHGFYKASHFLSAGSMIENPKPPQSRQVGLGFGQIILMLLAGVFGGALFTFLTGKNFMALNGGTFLILFAGFASAQAMYGFSQMQHWLLFKRIFTALVLIALAVATYAACFNSVDRLLPINIELSLNIFHFVFLGIFFICWLALLFGRFQKSESLYIRTLNSAQPPMATTMNDRRSYAR
jgi:NAD(P)H-quinone oxidoreductase subunit 5